MRLQAPPGIWRATWWVARKELLTSFRDRQTAIYTVVLPIALYPVIFWLMIQGTLLVQGRREHLTVQVAITQATSDPIPPELLPSISYAPGSSEESTGNDPIERVEPHFIDSASSVESAYESWTADEGLERDALLYLASAGEGPSKIAFDSTDNRSIVAEQRLRERMEEFAEQERSLAARQVGLDPRELHPVAIDLRNLAPAREMGAFLLSLLFPFLLVLMTIMGSFYPAVDLTAGERERGTSETTMILPIPRLAVHQGKILAVCASALLATSLNLLALGLSAGHLLKMIAAGNGIEIELPLSALLSIAPLALLFTFSVSALLTGFAALARNFKEGQALLGPLQMCFFLPAMAGMLPGLQLTVGTAFIPVVNVVLAFRSMLRGESLPLEYSLTAVCLLAYAVLAIMFAVRILSRESLGLSRETIPLQRMFSFLRSATSSR
jgi:sodium transport system permease protein